MMEKKETWNETIYRVVKGIFSYITEEQRKQLDETPEEMYELMFNMKFLPSGRCFMGNGYSYTNKVRRYSGKQLFILFIQ